MSNAERPQDDVARPRRTHGFRISVTDSVVLVLAAVSVVYLAPISEVLAFVIAMVVGHFFLFCNVVRLHRYLELTWGAIFIVNCFVWWMWLEDLRVLPVLAGQLPVTLLLVLLEVRSPRYHGIGARRINPRLDEFLSRA